MFACHAGDLRETIVPLFIEHTRMKQQRGKGKYSIHCQYLLVVTESDQQQLLPNLVDQIRQLDQPPFKHDNGMLLDQKHVDVRSRRPD